MKLRSLTAIALATGMLAAGARLRPAATARRRARSLTQYPPQMPFNLPFGTPIALEKAQALVQAAVAEANKRGWPEDFAVRRLGRQSGGLCADGRRPTRFDCHF